MNYAGHKKLRADVAEVANTMCDLRARLNDMEHRCRFDSDGRKRRMSTSVTRSIRAGSAFMFCWMRPGWRRYSLTATAAYCRRTWPPPFRN